jgi:pilus assembly protein Flp/PilA
VTRRYRLSAEETTLKDFVPTLPFVPATDKSSVSRNDVTIESGAGIMKHFFSRFAKDESGATAIEYGLIAALISVVVIVGVTAIGTKLSTTFSKIGGNLT